MSVISATFRARVRAGIEPLARVFGRVGLTPNALTLIGFAIAGVAAWFAAQQSWLIAGFLVAFGAIFDLFDGALARATGTTSRLGAFLDSVFDRAGEAVVYIGLSAGLAGSGLIWGPELAAAALGASLLVSYTRAKSESLGFSSGSGMANIGLAPREVRVAILALALIIAGLMYEPVNRFIPPWWLVLVGALALITLLATITAVQRILFVYKQAKSQEVTH